ncbi:replication initiation protein [Azotobacter chroococcum]|uniref:replication initiation protein n=1 Tax=Azotobacter chroococcum TaxID=353 RepID=UPI00362E9572
MADLTSTHSIRLFELLQQFRSTGFYAVSVAEFRELLELGPSYERYSNLKLKVIDPAIAELREKSGLLVELKTEKKGRAINRLTFKFRDDEQMKLNFPGLGYSRSISLSTPESLATYPESLATSTRNLSYLIAESHVALRLQGT